MQHISFEEGTIGTVAHLMFSIEMDTLDLPTLVEVNKQIKEKANGRPVFLTVDFKQTNLPLVNFELIQESATSLADVDILSAAFILINKGKLFDIASTAVGLFTRWTRMKIKLQSAKDLQDAIMIHSGHKQAV